MGKDTMPVCGIQNAISESVQNKRLREREQAAKVARRRFMSPPH